MKKFRNIISMALAIVMMLSLMPMISFAGGGEPETVTVTFDYNNGKDGMRTFTFTKGDSLSVPDFSTAIYVPEGKVLDAWTLNGERVEIGSQIILNENITLVAIWKDVHGTSPTTEQITITFAPGEGSGTMDPVKVDKNSKYALPACTFTPPTNKEFDKWDYGVAAGEVGTEINVAETDLTLTALWKDKTTQDPPANEKVKVTFNKNKHGGDPAITEVSIEKGTTVAKPDDQTDDNFDFGGWYTEDECTNPFDFADIIEIDTELYAKWTPKTVTPPAPTDQVTIKFVAGGGSGTMADVKANKNSEYTLPVSRFTAPANKEFKAWQCGNEEKAPGSKINVAEEDITLKALWKDKAGTGSSTIHLRTILNY